MPVPFLPFLRSGSRGQDVRPAPPAVFREELRHVASHAVRRQSICRRVFRPRGGISFVEESSRDVEIERPSICCRRDSELARKCAASVACTGVRNLLEICPLSRGTRAAGEHSSKLVTPVLGESAFAGPRHLLRQGSRLQLGRLFWHQDNVILGRRASRGRRLCRLVEQGGRLAGCSRPRRFLAT